MNICLDPFSSNRPYIKKEYHEKIIAHRPKSSCDSLYYAYVQSPLCDYIVSKLPPWVAPNLITIWGFSWNLFCLAFVQYMYGNTTEGYFSSYFAFFCGISYFFYTTADNCDGKQARKNGTGSVMGMLFDHGLDATTAFVMNIVIGRMLCIGGGLPAILAVQISCIPFYALTLEEYYIGMLNLPMFSGPDDTSLYISAICFLSAYMGYDWWMEELEVPFEIPDQVSFIFAKQYKRSSFCILCIYCFEVFTVLGGSLHKYWKARDESHFKERFTFQSFISHAGYMWLNVVIYDVYGILCGSQILHTHTRSVLCSFGGQFLQAVLRMIVANASGENFNPYRRTTVIAWSLMSINIAAFLFLGEPIINEQYLFRFINIMIWSAIAHFVYHIMNELKTILGINIFTVVPKVANPQESSTNKNQSKQQESNKKTN